MSTASRRGRGSAFVGPDDDLVFETIISTIDYADELGIRLGYQF
ncbi:hypothetical protein WQQ_08230 [Hydrocarboniphaga effusa AP103]|uniref:Uncharacterized protein n=1 Tax=Hydrocarboniphaga effusa AP103 TaxID=1172194 RepID=I8I3M9_9GAMM|nr:hypothetical protein WQQ_08230 [Hydrocarboniphaga effusa AP103]